MYIQEIFFTPLLVIVMKTTQLGKNTKDFFSFMQEGEAGHGQQRTIKKPTNLPAPLQVRKNQPKGKNKCLDTFLLNKAKS